MNMARGFGSCSSRVHFGNLKHKKHFHLKKYLKDERSFSFDFNMLDKFVAKQPKTKFSNYRCPTF